MINIPDEGTFWADGIILSGTLILDFVRLIRTNRRTVGQNATKVHQNKILPTFEFDNFCKFTKDNTLVYI